MLDIFYVAIVIVFFALMWGFTKAAERLLEDQMEYAIAGITAVLLFIYLMYALLRPERF